MTAYFKLFSFEEVIKITMVLFAVIDIVGSIPLIIKLKESSGDISPLRTSLVAMGIMLGFLILGESILNIFGVDIRSFAVAGSIIIFALALEMIMGWTLFKDEVSGKVASIVPLAFPILAGAGTMTSIVALKAEFAEVNIIAGIIINIIIIYAVLKLTRKIEAFLGKGGIGILKKVFGIILLAIALKLFTSNITYLI